MKKILLVDDEKSMCQLLSVILNDQYEVRIARNGFHALCVLSEGFCPDLIISDIVMPYMGGIELRANLRKSGLYRDIPFVLLTAAKREDPILLHHLQVDRCFTKPFDPISLKKEIGLLLNNARA